MFYSQPEGLTDRPSWKDAGAPPSFRTGPQPRPGFSPCDHRSHPLTEPFQYAARLTSRVEPRVAGAAVSASGAPQRDSWCQP
jgi:hypothetical protein